MSIRPLLPEQKRAADPELSAWVSASAGTGKTQVLTARVLRLLLAGARPDGLLALTFTKAAAAEMQTRIFETLSRWVRADEGALTAELVAIGAPSDEDTRRRARALFAEALETRGGLKVQTLHSFASALLAAFPLEAGIAPGYETLDDRSALRIHSETLAERIGSGDASLLADLADLSVQGGEARVQEVIAKLLAGRAVFENVYGKAVDWRGLVRRGLGLPVSGSRDEVLSDALADDAFDWETVREYTAAMVAWGTKTGLEAADTLGRVLGAAPEVRHDFLDDLVGIAFTAAGEFKKPPRKNDPYFDTLHARFCMVIGAVRDLAAGLDLAETAALHLRVGHAFAAAYETRKEAAGALDYADLIVKAARLLSTLAAPFVLFKLDQRIDHILVDEGQDTNAAQWAIVEAIADEFFAGTGTRDEAETGARTQFAVGDYKQAIFGFQGTDPRAFEAARVAAERRALGAEKPFETIDLALSFRSVPAVLDVVDTVVEAVGAAAFGIEGDIPRHAAHRAGAAGEVVLWAPVTGEPDDDDEVEDAVPEDAERTLAANIARQVAGWLERGELLASKGRPIAAGDIMLLVRSRGSLVPALVSALMAARVPVAGADRLRLTQPLAVQDLLALVRFALQPGDDLSLAALLVSPFLGWSQDDLYDLAFKRRGTLWRTLRDRSDDKARAAEDWLGKVLARADYMAPYEFLEYVLSGEPQGRLRLIARLGEEARDPIEELLNQALAYEGANTPSLQGFLSWIEADDVEVKRDAEAAHDAVRIMTVHGSKGLQAPIVIMADAASAVPKGAKPPLPLELPGLGPAPLFFGSSKTLVGPAREAYEAATRAEGEEHMRLLYVALTRAEDRLYVGGALGKRPSKAKSWHGHVTDALAALGAQSVADSVWGDVLRHASGTPAPVAAPTKPVRRTTPAIPAWALAMPPEEERPPRPLAPSAPQDDDPAEPPPGPALRAAARRGQVLHQLFERIGGVAPENRAAAVHAWLRRNAPDLDAGAIAAEVVGALADPTLTAWFAEGAYAEAPLSAVVEDVVITGTIDRLIVEEGVVRALDFKTGRNPPQDLSGVPTPHLRQMRAYRDALARIFPGHRIETALFYTAALRFIRVD
ncbi:double-strand break repair helicase AddA [Sphingosinicella microcystinivorans]|uniref:DNA 3'-5' helicase n=1 Tax=Sphingosinicella microcystinivorans TaxID=335406 RepID=A0AAD1D570_SPHMI|nr:double-strand break repair helicase AddA [Sphingosinicella microcystinivorans]RKS90704.1 DNA helicase/exodeoxyribonuclease V subunit A [Sphingosinicella microcystinivorans]BBE33618.1 double-strand break repair helicase AddA [Sphingosinicella microcystinivorans]